MDNGNVVVKPEAKESGLTQSRNPWAAMEELENEMDRWFDRSWPRLPRLWERLTRRAEGPAGWAPKIDVFSKDDKLHVKADLPGMRKEDIDVEIANGALIIKGERRDESEVKEEHYYRAERRYGSFYRQIPLPDGADLDKIEASFKDGVLEVSVPMPAAPKAEAKKIAIG